MSLRPLAAIVAIGALAPGCFLFHERDGEAPASAGAVDAATGPDASVAVPAPRECAASDWIVDVSVSGGGEHCVVGELFGYPSGHAIESGAVVLDIEVVADAEGMLETPGPCTVRVDGLSPDVRRAFDARLDRVYDAYLELAPSHLVLRDTSLCDGPARRECPVAMEAESGPVRPEPPGPRRVSVRWGDELCSTSCGGVRALDFALDLGHRVDTASLAQGEVNRDSTAGSRFANLRSFNSCLDVPDVVTWAFWLP